MNRQQKRKLLRDGERVRKLRDSNFQEFLRVSCLSAIGNMEPFMIFAIYLAGEDSNELSGIFAKNAKQTVAFYHQNAEGKITKVSLSSGEDLTAEFKHLEKRYRERFEFAELSDSVLTFEVIKAMNFFVEEQIQESLGHIIFTDKSVAELTTYTNEMFVHYDHHYGSKKPIYLAVYNLEEAVSTWH